LYLNYNFGGGRTEADITKMLTEVVFKVEKVLLSITMGVN